MEDLEEGPIHRFRFQGIVSLNLNENETLKRMLNKFLTSLGMTFEERKQEPRVLRIELDTNSISFDLSPQIFLFGLCPIIGPWICVHSVVGPVVNTGAHFLQNRSNSRSFRFLSSRRRCRSFRVAGK